MLCFVALFSCSKEILQQKLTVTASPSSGGTITPGSNSYEKGQSVQLLATPAGEYLFIGWNGDLTGATNPSNLIMDRDKQVVGMFEKRQYPLNLTIEGNGTVKEEVVSVATQSQYPSGTMVRLTAVPAEKYEFTSWSGDISNTSSPLEIKVDRSLAITVKFKIKDTDGDGILDDIDQDNTTRKGVPVDATGRMLNPVYLDGNQVTIKANKWAVVGDKGKINNVEYEVISRQKLDDLISNGGDYSTICTSLISDLKNLFMIIGQNTPGGYKVKYDISSWDVSNVTSMEGTFGNTILISDLSKWDVGKVNSMKFLFVGSSFNQDISNWNVSNVESMESMFFNCAFNGDLSKWNISSLKNIVYMFYRSKFNNPSINNWNTKKIESMSGTFSTSEFNQDISNWDVSNVKSMSAMFHQAYKFNQDSSRWNVGAVTDMQMMFSICYSFNQNISNWDVSKVTNMENMFLGSPEFNQDLSKWDVNNVVKCNKFNQNAFGWKLPKPSFKNCTF